jgi:hypothetical protein
VHNSGKDFCGAKLRSGVCYVLTIIAFPNCITNLLSKHDTSSSLHAGAVDHAHSHVAARRSSCSPRACSAHLGRRLRGQAQVGLLQPHLQRLLHLGELVRKLAQCVQNILRTHDKQVVMPIANEDNCTCVCNFAAKPLTCTTSLTTSARTVFSSSVPDTIAAGSTLSSSTARLRCFSVSRISRSSSSSICAC